MRAIIFRSLHDLKRFIYIEIIVFTSFASCAAVSAFARMCAVVDSPSGPESVDSGGSKLGFRFAGVDRKSFVSEVCNFCLYF